MNRWMSTMQVVEYSGFSRRTVDRAVSAGMLRVFYPAGTQTPRYKLEDVDAWLEGKRPKGRAAQPHPVALSAKQYMSSAR